MKYNLKEQLFDKIRGLEFVNPDEYGAKYNNGEEALAEIFEDYTYPIMVVGNIWEEEE